MATDIEKSSEEGKKPGIKAGAKPMTFIISFGVVSMLMDIVYEGALSVQGPLLLSLGASAAIVGIVSGVGEATALAGRLVSGPWADRTKKYWVFAITGYAITALTVPAMGIVGSVGGVAFLIIFERFGKSVRTPSRDAMISHASAAVGRGKGFAMHEVMDQIGAMAGPLIVAAILWATANNYAPALGILLIPGVAAICVLLGLRHRVPDPSVYEDGIEANASEEKPAAKDSGSSKNTTSNDSTSKKPKSKTISQLPKTFWAYATICGLVLSGVATFAVLSYHMVSTGIIGDAAVPVIYAVAMGVDAVFALITGNLYDKLGPRVLLVLPIVCAIIPLIAYGDQLWMLIVGAILWGASLGIQESTMRAYVADLVDTNHRASAFGVFSVFTGVGSFIGGTVAGTLYGINPAYIAVWSIVIEAIAFVALIVVMRRQRTATGA
jgi:MFS family permease